MTPCINLMIKTINTAITHKVCERRKRMTVKAKMPMTTEKKTSLRRKNPSSVNSPIWGWKWKLEQRREKWKFWASGNVSLGKWKYKKCYEPHTALFALPKCIVFLVHLGCFFMLFVYLKYLLNYIWQKYLFHNICWFAWCVYVPEFMGKKTCILLNIFKIIFVVLCDVCMYPY